jgi:N-acetyl-gamma-glutamyl-phosphate reductase
VVFLCTPHEASLDLAPQFIERGMVVIDLSAAFRLQRSESYPKFYGFEHAHAKLLRESVYGLPELFRERLAKPTTRLIAAPGCYPTSIILPLAAIARAGAIAEGSRPIIDATSGVSGAGRKAEQRLMFCEVSQSVYGVFKHRHQPEIDEYVGRPTLFTPHLGTYDRGILSTIHVDLAPGCNESRLREVLAAAYAHEPFVRLCKPGTWPAVGDVRTTNYCDIALAVDEPSRHAIIVSAIDNLTKGAAGQAVQAMNVRFGIEETAGLRR